MYSLVLPHLPRKSFNCALFLLSHQSFFSFHRIIFKKSINITLRPRPSITPPNNILIKSIWHFRHQGVLLPWVFLDSIDESRLESTDGVFREPAIYLSSSSLSERISQREHAQWLRLQWWRVRWFHLSRNFPENGDAALQCGHIRFFCSVFFCGMHFYASFILGLFFSFLEDRAGVVELTRAHLCVYLFPISLSFCFPAFKCFLPDSYVPLLKWPSLVGRTTSIVVFFFHTTTQNNNCKRKNKTWERVCCIDLLWCLGRFGLSRSLPRTAIGRALHKAPPKLWIIRETK